MIEKKQIENLGYILKTELINNTYDFVIQDEIFPRKINLANGIIQTIIGVNSKEKQKSFDDIEEFKKYYSK